MKSRIFQDKSRSINLIIWLRTTNELMSNPLSSIFESTQQLELE